MAQKSKDEVCNCEQYCLRSICESSNSGLIVKKCWCADCNEIRKEVKKNAFVIKEGK